MNAAQFLADFNESPFDQEICAYVRKCGTLSKAWKKCKRLDWMMQLAHASGLLKFYQVQFRKHAQHALDTATSNDPEMMRLAVLFSSHTGPGLLWSAMFTIGRFQDYERLCCELRKLIPDPFKGEK